MGAYAEFAERLVADWPPLTDDQQSTIRHILTAPKPEAEQRDREPRREDRDAA